MECIWCNATELVETKQDCYWMTPDEKRTLRLLDVPAVDCPKCGVYVTEEMNQKVEQTLVIADLTNCPDTLTYEELRKLPTINIFAPRD
ncbi:MAG: YokU family protein [Clostridia bacterium]